MKKAGRLAKGKQVREILLKFCREENGASSVEYAALAAIISIAAVATIFIIGRDIDAKFERLLQLINGAP